uniref:Uncharacterized protein n=1 Tax=Trichinella nativa TaxID=6335 RepID=A0A0V1KI05_9BILA
MHLVYAYFEPQESSKAELAVLCNALCLSSHR